MAVEKSAKLEVFCCSLEIPLNLSKNCHFVIVVQLIQCCHYICVFCVCRRFGDTVISLAQPIHSHH